METAFIGLLGVLLGVLLNEYFRKKSRIEIYSKEVFQKRLEIYEELYKKMEDSYLIAQDIIENPDSSITLIKSPEGHLVADARTNSLILKDKPAISKFFLLNCRLGLFSSRSF